jgi:hypothetical protein
MYSGKIAVPSGGGGKQKVEQYNTIVHSRVLECAKLAGYFHGMLKASISVNVWENGLKASKSISINHQSMI